MSNETLSKIKNIAVIVLVIAVIALIGTVIYGKRQLSAAESNVEALMDSVRVYQLSNGELMSAKRTLTIEKGELEKYLGISKAEVREMERELGSAMTYIAKVKEEMRVDTLRMTDSVYVSSDTVNAYFGYSDRWLTLGGVTECVKSECGTTLSTLSVEAPLKVGVTEDNQFFAVTDCPYLTFPSIEGADVSGQSKPKRWSVGLSLTVGPTGGWGAMFCPDGVVRSGGFVGLGGTIGVSVSYKLLEW